MLLLVLNEPQEQRQHNLVSDLEAFLCLMTHDSS